MATLASDGAGTQPPESEAPRAFDPDQAATSPNVPLIPAAFRVADNGESNVESRDPNSLEQAFEKKYDDLGPVDFAKRVIEFGDWLARQGPSLSPAERERALAEYSFLQDRLSFWLSYEHKSAITQANLLSSALALYQGAINGGIVRVGDFPRSMLDVAAAAWAFDNVPPRRILPSALPGVENAPRVGVPNEEDGLGGIVNNSEAKIDWEKVSKIKVTILRPITGEKILKTGDCCQELQGSIISTTQPAKP